MGLREDLFARRWKQGSLVQAQDNEKLQPHIPIKLSEDARLIVISQICDLLHDNLEAEPFAEVLVAIPLVGGPDGNYLNCRNPRRLHIPVIDTGAMSYMSARRMDVYPIPRQLLNELNPDPHRKLEDKVITTLAHWLAMRYFRAALPDNFEARLRRNGAREGIRKTLKAVTGDVEAIYIGLAPYAEIADDQPYSVVIFAVMEVEHFQNVERKKRSAEALEALVTALSNCDGIDVADYELIPENEMTLDDVKDLVLWNFDDLSYAANSAVQAPQNLGRV